MTTSTLAHRPLTQKQEAFCLLYFSLKNKTQAAIRAGYTPKTARSIGTELLANPSITARLAEIADRVTPDEDKLVAGEIERKRILTRIYRTETPPEDIKPDHVIRSIIEHNRMERIGTPANITQVVNNVVFVIGRGYANQPQLEEGKNA